MFRDFDMAAFFGTQESQGEADCSRYDNVQDVPCKMENQNDKGIHTNSDQKPAEVEMKPRAYDEKALIRYFINEGWTRQSAIELAKRMIERGSYLPVHEHVKYRKCDK